MFQFAGRKPPNTTNTDGVEVSSEVVQRAAAHDVLHSAGAPLDQSTRRDMEARLGTDFSQVRVHSDHSAQRSAAAFGAEAYTSGNHIVAGRGGLDRETLAHELVHVVQQRQGPVAGTDHGGVRVSDPGDRHEREADAGAKRAMSGAAPIVADTSTGEAAIGPVQRKLGFEVEIDLPVVNSAGQEFDEGDTELGETTRPLVQGGTEPAFQVVTDYRKLTATTTYSNIEFVSGAASVVGTEHDQSRARIQRIVNEMRAVQQRFYAMAAANPGSPLKDANINLRLTAEGETAKLPGVVGYPDTREANGEGGLFVHYSVGVPVTGIPEFFDQLRTADPYTRQQDPYNSNQQTPVPGQIAQARFRLNQARDFSRDVLAEFRRQRPRTRTASQNPEQEDASLDGYIQLVYTQLAGMTDFMRTGAGQPKNALSALSRANLAEVLAGLPERVRTFLDTFDIEDDNGFFSQLFDRYQEQTAGGGTVNFDLLQQRQVNDQTRTVTLVNYANSAFRRAGAGLPGGEVTQQEVFGGLNIIPPHLEQGSVMIPMEIRELGGRRKTWDQLQQDLNNLANWAEAAYRRDQGFLQSDSDQEAGPSTNRQRV